LPKGDGRWADRIRKNWRCVLNTGTLERILAPFVEEARPDGGIDMAVSRWQKPGRGYGGIFPDHPDVRYLHALVDLLYRVDRLVPDRGYGDLADRQVGFMARFTRADHPTWLHGTTLQCLGFHHQHHGETGALTETARCLVGWTRQRKVEIDTGDVAFVHFPCGYGVLKARDAGWTNDLSIFGSGLVCAYEVTGDPTMLEEAVRFAEYFVQPWRAGSLGQDGYWHAGTWRDDMNSWTIGPLHVAGIECTDLHSDEASWVFSTFSCIDYLSRLYRHRPDPRFLNCCVRAAGWTFDTCQFEDGAVGVCGRDDKWLGSTGYALSQIVALQRMRPD